MHTRTLKHVLIEFRTENIKSATCSITLFFLLLLYGKLECTFIKKINNFLKEHLI